MTENSGEGPANLDAVEEEEAVQADNGAGSSRTRTQVQRPYPRRTLEQAIRIGEAIKEYNGGNPWSQKDIGTALGVSPSSSNFRYLMAASRDFGLTTGANGSITLTALGQRAVYPTNESEAQEAIQAAFFNVEIFKRVVDHYQGSKLPDEPFLTNTLTTTFRLDASLVGEFRELFDKNCRYAGIGTDYLPGDFGGEATPRSGSKVISVSPRIKSGAPVCFIAMPFTEREDSHPIGFFKEVMNSVFKPAIESAGLEAKTALRQGSDVIHATIVNELLDADLVLADLTEHNPNVLFELGMRISANKPIVLVRAKGTGAIFDVDHLLRVEDYNPNLWPSTVPSDVAKLAEHIKGAWESRDDKQSFLDILRSTGK